MRPRINQEPLVSIQCKTDFEKRLFLEREVVELKRELNAVKVYANSIRKELQTKDSHLASLKSERKEHRLEIYKDEVYIGLKQTNKNLVDEIIELKNRNTNLQKNLKEAVGKIHSH